VLRLQYEEITVLRAYVADSIVEECVVVELKSVAKTGRVEERQLLRNEAPISRRGAVLSELSALSACVSARSQQRVQLRRYS
jgi:hypothetical protein